MALGAAGFRWLQGVATPPGIVDLGPVLAQAFRLPDEGLRVLIAGTAGPLPDAFFAAVALALHPAMLLLAPLLWLLADEERAAKGVIAAYAALLLVTIPAHYLIHVADPADRAFPFLEGVAGLLFPPGDFDKVPSLNTALAVCVAWGATRSRNWRFRPVAFAYPFLLAPALLYYGVNTLVGVGAGALFGAMASLLAERATSVERIAHQRVDAPPERKMKVREHADALLAAVGDAAAARGLQVEPRLVGSVAKDTFLAHKVDIDAFVLFPPGTPRRTLEEEGLALGRAVLERPEERFAEHPYLAGTWRGLDAEVVPAYKVEDASAIMSAVDRTPFHTAYVSQKLSYHQRRDVRLLKQFLLGIGVYGAEAKVQGFSGYLAELLVIKHGSFRGVLRAGAAWRVGQLLALEPFEAGGQRFQEPLVVIDPVDPGRNVASALSLDNLLLFQEAAQAYLREPRLAFFFPRPVAPLPRARLAEMARERGHPMLAWRVARPDVLEDSLHAQLRKAGKALAEALDRAGFKVLAWEADAEPSWGTVVVELESAAVNEREVHAGPPLAAKEHAERFRAKWTGNPRALSAVYEDQGRLMVARRREFTSAAAFLRARALELDVGKDLTATAHAKGFEVLEPEEVVDRLDPALLTRFLQRVRPWER